ncbi:MAG: response regulator [Bdellovibrionota bacterium]
MTKRKTDAEQTADSTKSLVFLVVDDEQTVRQTLVEYLQSFGYSNIFEAEDGAKALAILRSKKVDFIISDWEMPGTSGIELLRAIKTDVKLNHIPFIMVTSPISQERFKVEDAALSKVDGYIIKPFRAQVLREKIDLALSKSDVLGKNTALVVDDDAGVRTTIIEYLKHMGYTKVLEARDGEEGFQTLKMHASEIAFVICDWEMPKLQGIDLLQLIRNDEQLKGVPFIMVTSQTSIEHMKLKRALEANVDNYLLKPFRSEDLRKRVEQVLEKAKGHAVVRRELERGREFLTTGRWSEAIRIFSQIVTRDPSNIEAYLGLGAAQRHLAPEKAIPKATQYIRQAIAIDPHCEQAYIDLALIFESAMSLDKAIATLREALVPCEFSEHVHFQLGRLLIRRGNQSEGIKELQRALELNPDLKEAQELLAGRSDG